MPGLIVTRMQDGPEGSSLECGGHGPNTAAPEGAGRPRPCCAVWVARPLRGPVRAAAPGVQGAAPAPCASFVRPAADSRRGPREARPAGGGFLFGRCSPVQCLKRHAPGATLFCRARDLGSHLARMGTLTRQPRPSPRPWAPCLGKRLSTGRTSSPLPRPPGAMQNTPPHAPLRKGALATRAETQCVRPCALPTPSLPPRPPTNRNPLASGRARPPRRQRRRGRRRAAALRAPAVPRCKPPRVAALRGLQGAGSAARTPMQTYCLRPCKTPHCGLSTCH
jgi:hypothetical protein